MSDNNLNNIIWKNIFDQLLDIISVEKKNLPETPIIQSVSALKFEDIKTDTKREIFSLYERALGTLKQDKISGEPGDLKYAVQLLSLRNSTLAKTLGVKPPRLTQMVSPIIAGNEEQRAFSTLDALMDMTQQDINVSMDKLKQAFNNAKERDTQLSQANGHILTQAEQSILENLLQDAPQPPVQTIGLSPFHQQTWMTLTVLGQEYEAIHHLMKKYIDGMRPEGPKNSPTPRMVKTPLKSTRL